MNQHNRWVELTGTKNCRDLGNIPATNGTTRRGTVYRSDALHQLTADDNQTLIDIDIGMIIDLRVPFEKDKAPNRLSEALSRRQLARPFLPAATRDLFERVNSGDMTPASTREWMHEHYRILTLEHTTDYQQLFRDMLDAGERSVLVHCTSGKDRTGMFSALLLAALGVDESDIIDDYALTNGRIPPVTYLDQTIDPEVLAAIMAADPGYLATAFATMREHYGSVEAYLQRGVGLGEHQRERLCSELIV